MAAKHLRRNLQNVSSSLKSPMEKGKNHRQSRSGLNLSNISSKATKNSRNSAQHNKGIGSMKKKLQVVHPNIQSPVKSPETRQRINKNKQAQGEANSLYSPVASLDRTRQSSRIMQRNRFTEIKNNSSRLSTNVNLDTSLLTPSQVKLYNSAEWKSKAHMTDICSINPATYLPKISNRKSGLVGRTNARMDSLVRRKTSSTGFIRKSLDVVTNATKQIKNMSACPIADSLMLRDSPCTVPLLERTVKRRRIQRISDEGFEIRKRPYLRSQSEKIHNLKPVVRSRRKMASFPTDDLVSMTSKPIPRKEICVLEPISNISSKKLDLPKSECKVVKISKNSLKEGKSKSLPRKTSKQASSVDSKKSKNTKRKDVNSPSVDMNSNLTPARRLTRSSVLLDKSMDCKISLPSKKVEKKSKRHTFPMNGKYSVSSQNHQIVNKSKRNCEANDWKLNSTGMLNHSNSINHTDVPIDDLTILPNSYFACTYRSKNMCITSSPMKYIPINIPRIQRKNQVASKSKKAAVCEIPKTSNSWKKTSLGKKQVTNKSKEVTEREITKTGNSRKKASLGLNNSIPGKGSLKRKRWIFNALNKANDGYEDDIFETNKFEKMKIPNDESDTTDNSIATPKCGFILTPSLPKKTPLYKECISSTELLEARKVAEEYLFRRNKKWKSESRVDSDEQSSMNMTGTSENEAYLPEKKKLNYSEVLQNVIGKLTQDNEEHEDAYFSDISD